MSGRKSLPHDVPHWVKDHPTFFIIICASDRKSQPLLQDDLPARLLEAIHYQHGQGFWWTHVAVIMPDHVHLLATFPVSMPESIARRKQWTSRNCGVEWQRDFFDHRLRNEESVREKCDYILLNPVRAGLVANWQKWPHYWIGE